MKPIDDIVPFDYQNPAWSSCSVPGRPWWTANGRVLTRTDGETVTFPTYWDMFAAVAASHEGSLVQRYQDACREIDEAKPLPLPVLRVGQIWAVSFPQFRVVVGPITAPDLVHPHGSHGKDRYVLTRLVVAHCDAMRRQGWDATVIGLDRTPNITDVALIHDPCRPDLAPWTGVL